MPIRPGGPRSRPPQSPEAPTTNATNPPAGNTTAPATTPATNSSQPPCPTTTPATQPSAPQDQFEATPGASFTNQLLGLDTNADGRLTRTELAAGAEDLARLSQDGRENDLAEGSVLRLLMQNAGGASQAQQPALEYAVVDGQLQLNIQGENGTNTQLSFAHENVDPGLQSEVLLDRAEANVVHGTDPGDFYCEHMFFSGQMEASRPESSVVTNDAGEKLVGFLHVPSDPFTSQRVPSGYTQAERHEGSRQVVGAALRGYIDQAAAGVEEGPVRMLLTGYDEFSWVRNNPTGDFVTHRENVDASMQLAFGDRLVQPEGEIVSSGGPDDPEVTYRYQVRDPDSGDVREVLLTTMRFPVTDEAISPQAEHSIQQLMAEHQPHAVLSMGVAGRGSYRAEHQADSGGLQRTEDDASHVEGASGSVQLRDNFSLARAIEAGVRANENP